MRCFWLTIMFGDHGSGWILCYSSIGPAGRGERVWTVNASKDAGRALPQLIEKNENYPIARLTVCFWTAFPEVAVTTPFRLMFAGRLSGIVSG